jgi:cobalt-zinc-cadmium efflux system membrane fusion protein
MPSSQANPVLQYIRKVAAEKSLLDLADPELLDQFITQRDETAFAALVRRHGPMVLGLCLRILHNEQDAEDAFQSTFLVFSRQAASLRPHKSLVGWLYSVAYRTAQKARLDAARRRKYEGGTTVAEVADPLAQITVREVHEILDRELTRLPVKFRVPLVLCYLEGLTRDEAAQRLDWPVSLLKSRLEQARERLRVRLTSQGLSLAGIFVASVFHEGTASAAVPPALLVSTVKAGTAVAGGGTAALLVPPSVAALTERVMKAMFMTKLKTATLGLLVLSLLSLGMGLSTQHVRAGKPEGDKGPALERRKGDTVHLPPEMLTKLGIQAAEVKSRAAPEPRVLHLRGSTALDPQRISRVRARFVPFRVLEIGKPDGQDREFRPGDVASKGQVLALVSSLDVSQKKHDLFSALVQLKLDETILERIERAATAVPEIMLLNARRTVEGDHNAIARTLNNLKGWGVSDNDIAAIRQEAREAGANGKPDTEDMRKARLEQWSKVELRAEIAGIIIERNLQQHEVVNDGTGNLFQLANMDQLLILANVSEEDLPSLQALKASERRWTIQTAGGGTPVEGVIDEIGYLIDPNQHTAVVKGHIDNKNHQLRAGQYITATVVLPRPVAEVVLPSSALVEDDHQTFIFIQIDAKKFAYEQRRVLVVRRGKDAVHVRTRLTPEQERQGYQTVRPGEHVVTAGVLELKAILDDLKAAQDR